MKKWSDGLREARDASAKLLLPCSGSTTTATPAMNATPDRPVNHSGTSYFTLANMISARMPMA